MTTTLTVLGGSAAAVGTGQGCAGYLVSTDATTIALDLGPGTLLELRKYTDYRALDAVVLSHLHVDHMLDLVALRFSLAYNPVRPGRNVPLWLPPGGIAFLDHLGQVFGQGEAKTFFSDHFELAEYDPNGHVWVGDLRLTFAPTVHFVPCWAIRVHPLNGTGASTSDLVYTADTGPAANLAGFARGAHVVLAEATTPEAQRESMPFAERGHLTAAEATTLARDAGASILVLTHMFEEHDPAASVAAVSATFGGTVLRAVPGATVTWP